MGGVFSQKLKTQNYPHLPLNLNILIYGLVVSLKDMHNRSYGPDAEITKWGSFSCVNEEVKLDSHNGPHGLKNY